MQCADVSTMVHAVGCQCHTHTMSLAAIAAAPIHSPPLLSKLPRSIYRCVTPCVAVSNPYLQSILATLCVAYSVTDLASILRAGTTPVAGAHSSHDHGEGGSRSEGAENMGGGGGGWGSAHAWPNLFVSGRDIMARYLSIDPIDSPRSPSRRGRAGKAGKAGRAGGRSAPPPEPTTGVKMSRIKVLKICCASETKMIEKIVRPLPGVTEVRVNVVTKTAYVEKSLKYSV